MRIGVVLHFECECSLVLDIISSQGIDRPSRLCKIEGSIVLGNSLSECLSVTCIREFRTS